MFCFFLKKKTILVFTIESKYATILSDKTSQFKLHWEKIQKISQQSIKNLQTFNSIDKQSNSLFNFFFLI